MTKKELITNIRQWLDKELSTQDISEEDVKSGALMLLSCNANRNMYNFLVHRKKASRTRKKLAYELNKHLKILLSKVTLEQIEEMKPQVAEIAKDVEEKTEEPENEKEDDVKVRFSGKRSDHEQLPKEIQVLYEQTLNLLRKERQLTEKLKLLEKNPPCDRHEYVIQLIELDTKRHECWEMYDHYERKEDEPKTEVALETSSAETAKTIISCRSFISKKLTKLEKLKGDSLNLFQYETLKVAVQKKYDIAISAGATFSDDYKSKLKAVGIKTE